MRGRIETLALRAGRQPDPATDARAAPIYQSTSFMFHDSEHAARLFAPEEEGHVHLRISNPTVFVLKERVAVPKGGVSADFPATLGWLGVARRHPGQHRRGPGTDLTAPRRA